MEYSIRQVMPWDKGAWDQVVTLLTGEGITLDQNLDYTAAVYNPSGVMVATGSCFKNTLRCLAVNSKLRGEGLLNLLVSHLRNVLAEQAVFDVFLYTKYDAAKYFRDLGFYTLATVDRAVVFMENNATAFKEYLNSLKVGLRESKRVAAIVMNANPFTLGHQYLVETAAAECDVLHLFIVKEDISAFSYEVRERLVKSGTEHLNNIVYHHTGNYIVSSATFPSYFIKESEEVTRAQAGVDAAVFEQIAKTLGITIRFVGDEPFSFATNLYNQEMQKRLPKYGVELKILPRKVDSSGKAISATRVREYIVQKEWDSLKTLLPESTLLYLKSDEGNLLLEQIHDKLKIRKGE